MPSAFYSIQERAFRESLAYLGVDIVIDGGLPKQCIASPLELDNALEQVGRVEESRIRSVTMLASDFDEFDVVSNQTSCVIDGRTMTIGLIMRGPQDPCVRFSTVGDI